MHFWGEKRYIFASSSKWSQLKFPLVKQKLLYFSWFCHRWLSTGRSLIEGDFENVTLFIIWRKHILFCAINGYFQDFELLIQGLKASVFFFISFLVFYFNFFKIIISLNLEFYNIYFKKLFHIQRICIANRSLFFSWGLIYIFIHIYGRKNMVKNGAIVHPIRVDTGSNCCMVKHIAVYLDLLMINLKKKFKLSQEI